MPSRRSPKRPANDIDLDDHPDHNPPLGDRPRKTNFASGPKLPHTKGGQPKSGQPEALNPEALNPEASKLETLSEDPEASPERPEALPKDPEYLIAAFFHSLFGLSFDAEPMLFSPEWEYLPATQAAKAEAAKGEVVDDTAPSKYRPEDDPRRNNSKRNEPRQEVGLPEHQSRKAKINDEARVDEDKEKEDKDTLTPAQEPASENGTVPRARFPSGPIARDQPGLIARRLGTDLDITNMLPRLYYAAAMAEVFVFPFQIAHYPAEKAVQNQAIARIVGLDSAVQVGLIEGYVICWPRGRFPKRASSIRLRVPGGRRERGRALGEIEAPLRAWIKTQLSN